MAHTMSGTISISIDEGTITTDDNETFQESLIEELFGAEQFSEVDTCVELMKPPSSSNKKSKQLQDLSVANSSIKTSKSSGSRKSKSKSSKLHTAAVHAHAAAVQAQARKSGKTVQPIDEDVDKLVREDVRKMIAKIRNSTQPKPHESSSAGTDKKLVRPGKYGEMDPRAAKARKELARQSKKDKAKKRKQSSTPSKSPAKRRESPSKRREAPPKVDGTNTREPGTVTSNGATTNGTATTTPAANKGGLEEVREQPEQTSSDQQTSLSSQEKSEPKNTTKEGYYKNQTEASVEQMMMLGVGSDDAPKEKEKTIVVSQAQAEQSSNDADNEESSSNPAVEKSDAVSVAAGSVAPATASSNEKTTEENAKGSDDDRKAEEATRDEEAKDDQGEDSPIQDEGQEREGSSAASTVEEKNDQNDMERILILSMPNVEKSGEADDGDDESEPIECVLATWEDIKEEEKALQREFGQKPDPSNDQAMLRSSDEYDAGVERQLTEENERTRLPDLKPDPSEAKELKPDPSEVKDLKRVVSAGQKSTATAPEDQVVEPVTTQSVAASLSHNEPSKEKESAPEPESEMKTKTNPTEIAGGTSTSEKEDATKTDVHGENETSQEDLLREALTGGETNDGDDGDDGTDGTSAGSTVELVLVTDSDRVNRLEYENAKLKGTLLFLQRTAVEKEKYFAELAWFGKRSEDEVKKWRPNFWREKLAEFGPELFEEFRADAMRIADPDVGDWEHGFSSGSLAMARLLLGLSHAVEDEKICAFHDPDQKCTAHCVTSTVAEQRARELADFPVLDP